MTRDEAIVVRSRQLEGKPVGALELQEAIYTLSKRRNRKFVLPDLPRPIKEAANLTLMFNIGKAMR